MFVKTELSVLYQICSSSLYQTINQQNLDSMSEKQLVWNSFRKGYTATFQETYKLDKRLWVSCYLSPLMMTSVPYMAFMDLLSNFIRILSKHKIG